MMWRSVLGMVMIAVFGSALDSPSWLGIGLAGAGAVGGLVLLYCELRKEEAGNVERHTDL